MSVATDSFSRFEAAVRVRSLASCLLQTCLLAYVLAGWLDVEPRGVVLIAVAALGNLGGYWVTRRAPRPAVKLAHRLSPLWGVATWILLTHWTGGVQSSLFVVGLWFEILLAAAGHTPRGIAILTLATTAGLWAQQLLLPGPLPLTPLTLQTSFLLLLGLTGGAIRTSWLKNQARMSTRIGEQQARLALIEQKLEDTQNLAALGAQTARLGHALKNAVHNLRGFTRLIENRTPSSPTERAELEGLKMAIDQLEVLALESLAPAPSSAPPTPAPPSATPPDGRTRPTRPTSNGHAHPEPVEEAYTVPRPDPDEPPADLREVLDQAARKIRRCYPDVRCQVVWNDGQRELRVPRAVLDEVLDNLLRNSAESMQKSGEVTVHVRRSGERCEIDVTDQGPGVPPEMAEHIFRPGQTSKPDGHGMGLYLARELMEAQGGALTLGPRDVSARGASFRVRLPEAWGA